MAGLSHRLLERAASKSKEMLVNTEDLLQHRGRHHQQLEQQVATHPSMSSRAVALTSPAQPLCEDVLGAGELQVAQRLAAVICEGGMGGCAQSEEQQEEAMCLWQWLQDWKVRT